MLTPSSHVKLAFYEDDTGAIDRPRQPPQLVGYLDTYLSTFEH
jgi:hypothetical protein